MPATQNQGAPGGERAARQQPLQVHGVEIHGTVHLHRPQPRHLGLELLPEPLRQARQVLEPVQHKRRRTVQALKVRQRRHRLQGGLRAALGRCRLGRRGQQGEGEQAWHERQQLAQPWQPRLRHGDCQCAEGGCAAEHGGQRVDGLGPAGLDVEGVQGGEAGRGDEARGVNFAGDFDHQAPQLPQLGGSAHGAADACRREAPDLDGHAEQRARQLAHSRHPLLRARLLCSSVRPDAEMLQLRARGRNRCDDCRVAHVRTLGVRVEGEMCDARVLRVRCCRGRRAHAGCHQGAGVGTVGSSGRGGGTQESDHRRQLLSCQGR
mmetsp:Transcript_17944/g.45201  ORF Transcript_17944/g.45201 Transcript_17944/m.45201 type:complete len:321 (-) Transcript_17944:882-1844(-)